MSDRVLVVLACVAAVLVVATLVGTVLALRTKDERRRATVANLNARTRAWWVMVAVLGAALAFGEGATLVLFALVSFFALREFVSLTPTLPGDYRPLAVSFWIVLPGQYWLIGAGQYGTFSILVPVYAFLLLPSLAALAGDTRDFLARAAKLQWALMTCVYCVGHAAALLVLDIPDWDGPNELLLLYLLLVAQGSDVLQYVFGKLLGRTKLAPEVSPSKTVEGLVGGGLAATALGAALAPLTPFPWTEAAALAAAIVVMGFLGGLTLSAVKRSLGVKDWGVMIEGHGGMLDRLDSIAFAAPVFFHLTRYFHT